MAENHGFQTIMGVGLEGTWGTAVPVTAKLPYISDGLDANFEHDQTRALVGSAAMRKSTKGQRVAGGPIETYFTYDLQQPILEQFFGTFTDETDPTDDHYDLDTVTTGSGLTVAINRIVSIHEYVGYRVSKLTFTGSPGDSVKITVEGSAQDRLLSGTENDASELAALSEPGAEVLFHEMTLRIGDLANPLAASDDICPTEFTLELDRSHVVKRVNKTTAFQALENDFFIANLTFTLPTYDTNQFVTWHEAHTTLQGALIFTDSTSTKRIHMPQMLVTSEPLSQDGAEMIEPTITMSAHPNADSANAHADFDFAEVVRIFEE